MARFAAGLRCIVAALCGALLAAGDAPLPAALLATVVVYGLWVGLVLLAQARGQPLAQPLLLYWIDIAWSGLLLQLSDANDSLAVVTMVLPVVMVSIGCSVRHGLGLSVFAALCVLLKLDRSGWGWHSEHIGLALAVLGLVPAAALLSRPMSVLRQRLGLVRDLEARLDPRRGLAHVATTLIEGLRGDLGADLTGIVLPAALSGPALICTEEDGAFPAAPAVHAQLEKLLREMPPCPVTHIAPRGAAGPGRTRLHGPGGDGVRAGLGPALDKLCALLQIRVLMVVPLRRYDQPHGHLLIGRCRARVRDQELEALAQAAPDIFRTLEQAALVDSLARETAAHERVRIGRDLHDSAIQPYLGLKYAVEALAQRVPPDNPAHAQIESLLPLISDEIAGLREVVSGLRSGEPGGDNALLPAVRRQVKHFSNLFGIEVQLECPNELRTTRAQAGAVFHMINEALNNVRRHTCARHVKVVVARQEDWLRIGVCDDAGTLRGRMAPAFVPRSLVERAAELGGKAEVTRPDGLNTEVVITVPLDVRLQA